MNLEELVFYDPQSGLIRWRKTTSRRAIGGRPLGSVRKDGYLETAVGGKRFLVHRLAWRLMTGEWPAEQVDHINRQRSDNRWENLRLANAAENKWNCGARSHNRSGLKGVTFHPETGKWRARIRKFGKVKSLGLFDTKEQAALAYAAAATEMHGEFASPNPLEDIRHVQLS